MEYKCSQCGSSNVKLWRGYMEINVTLRCRGCTEAKEGKRVNLSESDQCGWSVPAVPIIGREGFHGYLHTPKDRKAWWHSLA